MCLGGGSKEDYDLRKFTQPAFSGFNFDLQSYVLSLWLQWTSDVSFVISEHKSKSDPERAGH